MRRLIILLTVLLSFQILAKNSSVTVDASHFTKKIISLNFHIDNGIHIYWKNPGDVGKSTIIKFKQNGKEFNVKEFPWPLPTPHINKTDILSYGLEGEFSLFFDLSIIPDGLINVEIQMVACSSICQNVKKEINFKIENNEIKLPQDKSLKYLFDNLPKKVDIPNDFSYKLIQIDDIKLSLNYRFKNFTHESGQLFYPLLVSPFLFDRESVTNKDPLEGEYSIEWEGEYQEPEIKLPTDGKFKNPYTFTLYYFNSNTNQAEFFSIPIKSIEMEDEIKSDTNIQKSLWLIFLAALLGGLILNIMPCVLPIITLKAYSIIDNSKASGRASNLAYLAGIYVSFMILIGVILLLQSFGHSVGWGLHLQSPTFIALVSIFLFIFTLNLLGVFEVGLGFIGRIIPTTKSGIGGDFVSGILSTILATPCSAPFLGGAIGYALTQGAPVIILIFLAVATGLAFPFIILTIWPSLLSKFLPKPGEWMNTLKKWMGLGMLITLFWLLGILTDLLPDKSTTLYMGTVLSFIFFSIWGEGKIYKNKIIKISLWGISILLLISLLTLEDHDTVWENWTPETSETIKGSGERALIDITAKWCITCQANKKLLLETDSFLRFAEENQITLIRADWTNGDERITKFLAKNGLAGVPAYFLITDGEIKSLGEIITINKIKDSL